MKSFTYLLGLCTLILVTACSGTPTLEEKPSSEFTGLQKVSSSGFSEAWARADAGLTNFRVIAPSDMVSANAEIIQPGGSTGSRISRGDMEMTAERQQALVAAWRRSITTAAEKQGLAIDGNGDKVLRIDAEITRIAPSANFAEEQQAPGRTTVYTEDSGDASIEFKLYDQASGELLAVIRDKRSIGSQMWGRSNTVTASADVRNLLNSWATRLTSRISGE